MAKFSKEIEETLAWFLKTFEGEVTREYLVEATNGWLKDSHYTNLGDYISDCMLIDGFGMSNG